MPLGLQLFYQYQTKYKTIYSSLLLLCPSLVLFAPRFMFVLMFLRNIYSKNNMCSTSNIRLNCWHSAYQISRTDIPSHPTYIIHYGSLVYRIKSCVRTIFRDAACLQQTTALQQAQLLSILCMEIDIIVGLTLDINHDMRNPNWSDTNSTQLQHVACVLDFYI